MLSAFELSGLGSRCGQTLGTWVFHWAYLFFGPCEWACTPIFQTLSVAPQPLCTVYVCKGCNVSRIGAIFTCMLGAGLVRALSLSYVL